MRRFGRYSLRLLAVPFVLLLAVLAALSVLLWTTRGRALTSRVATSWISGKVAGKVELGLIGGNLLDHLTVDGVRITDSLGTEIIRTPHLDVRYNLGDLIAGRLIFSAVTIDTAVVHLARVQRGTKSLWNYEAVFRSGSGPAGGPPPLVELRNLVLRDASVRLDMPSDPHPPRVPVSRHGAAPDQPTLVMTPNGLVRVYTFEHVDAKVRYLRLSTPDHLPLLADVSSLRTEIGDPRIHLTDFEGTLLTAGDTLRFTLVHADMPHTRVRGKGAVRWPNGPMRFDFTLDAERADLADLKWVSPDFPDWTGAGHLVAFSTSDSRTEYRLDHLTMGRGPASASGKLVAIVDNARGLGMRDLDLALKATPLDVMRPYLDTLPFAGTLTGHLTADGFLDAMRLGGDLVFADAMVAGSPSSHLVPDGVVHFGGATGAVFEDFRLMRSDIALATVHRVSPSMVLPGTMRLDGHLNGPWENADFLGTVEHHAPDGSVSRLIGAVRLDIRDTILGVTLNADFDQLSFDALRSGYPDITARGGLVGHVIASGSLAALDIDANLSGDIGTVVAKGRIAAMSPRFTADALSIDLERFDLEALMGQGQSSSLNGHLLVTGAIDSLVPPRGQVELQLDRSRLGGITFSSATAKLSAASGILTFDTATVVWPDGGLSARGTLGWAAPDSGTLAVEAYATALGSLDSLARATLGFARDTLHPQPFDGTARASFVVHGSRDAMSVVGTVDAQKVVLDAWHLKTLHASITADSLGARGLSVDAFLDSLGHGTQLADSIHLLASGRKDSLVVSGGGRMNDVAASGSGSYVTQSTGSVIGVQSLALDFPRQHWRLMKPARFTMTDRATVLSDTVQLQTRDGSGLITLFGSIPGSGEGELGASVVGLNMADVYGLLQRDTTVLSGLATLDFRLGGSREAPTLRGNASVTGPVSGAVHAPLVHAAFDYQAKRLRSNVTFWTTGDPILDVEVSLPIDLALVKREQRRLPGPISITAQADSIDLLVLEALLPGVRNTRGSMRLNFAASGTWEAPKFVGDLALRDAEMTVPTLRVRYAGIGGKARFTGDSLLVDSLRLDSGGGSLLINGDVRFTNLTHPMLDLKLNARDFLAMDTPNFLRLRPTGNVTLTGPLMQPVLRSADGEPVEVSGSILYFADLLSKNVLDTEDPLLRDLIDTASVRRQGLGPDFQNRFLDSLRIENLTFQLGSDNWLRSSEANIQLEGQVQVDKIRKQYQLVGSLNAPRGTYTLRIGGVFPRLFTVESGTVQYSREPDLNASLNLRASHHVRTTDGDDVLISAAITGSILVPKLELSSPGRNLTTNEMVSYLAVGRPDLQLSGQFASQTVAVFSSELQRTLLAGGLPLDVFEFRPGLASGASGSALWQLSAGKQLGAKWFVLVNAGVCVGAGNSSLSQRNFGASLEYRMNREFRLQASAAPVQSCSSNRATDVFSTLTRYQLGTDILWSREY
jgi:autotransporter translocation and assembly factor TamB